MSAFSNNPFALLGEEETETDKLGNTKPVEKKKEEPTTRAAKRDAERKRQGRVAVSPPSARRGRDRGLSQPDDSRRGEKTESGPVDIVEAGGSRPGYAGNRPTRYHREHDRQSGTGLYDSEKKINQGWGHLGTSEQQAWNDELNPNDPVAEDGKAAGSGTATPAEPEFKTLDEYLASRPNLDERFRRKEARAANEGVDESQWKDAVPLQRNKEDDVYYGGKEMAAKQRSKTKKEKVYLEIDQPPHRPSTGRSGRGRGNRGGRSRDRAIDTDIDITDSSTFPTLGA